MSSSPSSSKTNVDSFKEFTENPKNSNMETIKGAHRYINDVIQGRADGPNKAILISLFNEFVEGEIKHYVYQSMRKSILLELSLCVLQEIGTHGVDHAKSLKLKLEKTTANGKRIVIDKEKSEAEFPITPAEESALKDLEIDDAIFRLSDSLGNSPDVTVHSGQGRAPPYLPPDECGYFTPSKSDRKSLSKDFDKVGAKLSEQKLLKYQ